jgi:hypothetical protein
MLLCVQKHKQIMLHMWYPSKHELKKNTCAASSSINGFWLPLWYLQTLLIFLDSKKILSVFRRCLNKDVGTACITDQEHIVCSGTCQEDYCNGKTKQFSASGTDNGHTITYSRILYLISIMLCILLPLLLNT